MTKLRIFLNDPKGKTWESIDSILPGVGEKYKLEIEIISKTRDAYRTTDYQATGLPIAPAIMLGNELITQGKPISEEALDSAIHRHLPNEWTLEDENQEQPFRPFLVPLSRSGSYSHQMDTAH